MKRCPNCEQILSENNFSKDSHTKSKLACYCKFCQNEKNRKYRSKNPKQVKKSKQQDYIKHKDAYLRRAGKRREKMIYEYFSYLLEHPCVECGESDPVVLDFHHINKNNKIAEVSNLIYAEGKFLNNPAVQKEILKCEVLCSNCHRKKTAKQRNSLKYRFGMHFQNRKANLSEVLNNE